MTHDTSHLTEDERHAAADGTLTVDRRAVVDAHLAACDDCAADVARIAEFMKRTRESASVVTEPIEDLWPPIRARIEARKVVPLGGDGTAPATRPRGGAWLIVAGLAAAVLLLIVIQRIAPRGAIGRSVAQVVVPDSSQLIQVADSTEVYEAEAKILLDRLEIQRATLRPETVAAIDRNLHTVDVAIAELKDAIARDPRNPALRQLLATSYRQKVELLKHAANAG